MDWQNTDIILLAHGDGGELTHQLVDKLFRKYFDSDYLKLLSDAAVVPSCSGRLALTTDSFVVNPLFFPGGDIGKLAVCGTVNDLAVSGALPRYLTASFIIEEGLEISVLEKVVCSMAEACRTAGVEIAAGDTKVVEKGKVDRLYINTAGIGWLPAKVDLGYHRIAPGDIVMINGTLGDHGTAVIAERYGFEISEQLVSDCAPLNGIIKDLLERCPGVKVLRDLTRGGLATSAKEIALSAGHDLWLVEESLEIACVVRGAAQMLGLDPVYLANEGKFMVIIDPHKAETALDLLRSHPLGKMASPVGEIKEGKGNVYLKTVLGGTKQLEMLAGSPLPKIC